MKLLWKLSVPQICIALLLGIVSYVVLTVSFGSIRERYVTDMVNNSFNSIQSGIAASSQLAVDLSALFAQMPDVVDAYALASAGDINDVYSPSSQMARDKIRRDLAPLLNSYAQYAGEKLQLHFHLPNGYSLVRLWRDKQTRVNGEWVDISDDLSTFRPTVMDVNRNKKPVMGIELGSGGIALRGVVPVTDAQDNMLGSVEVLQDFAPILEAAVQEGQSDIAMYINADNLSVATALQDESKNPRIGNFVRVVAFGGEQYEQAVTAKLLEQGKAGSFFEEHNGFTLSTMPLNDYKGNQIGVLVHSMQTSAISGMANNAVLTMFAIFGSMLVVLLAAMFFVMRKVVIRPLDSMKTRMELMASEWGDLDVTIGKGKRLDEIEEVNSLFAAFTKKLDFVLDEANEYTAMLNSVADPIFMVNSDFKIVKANQAMMNMFALSPEDLGHVHCHEKMQTSLCHTENCPVFLSKQQNGLVEVDITEITLEGEQAFIKPSSTVVSDVHGKGIGYVTVGSIVTGLVNSERRINAQLEKSQEINRTIRESSEQLSDATKQFESQFEEVEASTMSQSAHLNEIAIAMDQMNESIQLIAQRSAETAEQSKTAREQAQDGANIVAQAVQSILDVQDKAGMVKTAMANLSEQAEGTSTILSAISDIADQTNLLALNAAIEAARAGEAGRGFAVVADEVRKLAEKTMEATVEVNRSISSIQQGAAASTQRVEEVGLLVEQASELGAKSGEALEQIVKLMVGAADQITEVASAVEEQSATSDEISHTIETVTQVSQTVMQNINESGESLRRLSQLSNTLDALAQKE